MQSHASLSEPIVALINCKYECYLLYATLCIAVPNRPNLLSSQVHSTGLCQLSDLFTTICEVSLDIVFAKEILVALCTIEMRSITAAYGSIKMRIPFGNLCRLVPQESFPTVRKSAPTITSLLAKV
jgi:hypothetical protein